MPFDPYYAARDQIRSFIEKDAFGPVEQEEVLGEQPLDAYVCGILWPKGTQTLQPPAADRKPEALEAGEQTGDQDAGSELEEDQSDVIREANQYRPSVMALSFALPADCKTIQLRVTAARYTHREIPVENKSYVLHEYSRIPMDTGNLEVRLPGKNGKLLCFNGRGLLRIMRRRSNEDHTCLWTVSLENNKVASRKEVDQNISSLFQCRLSLEGDFQPISENRMTGSNEDRNIQAFLYRKTCSYAVGHGCSAAWDREAEPVRKIESSFLPMAVVSQMIASTDSSFTCFRMCSWTDARKQKVLEEMSRYVEGYLAWAQGLERKIPRLSEQYAGTARELLQHIYDCAERLRTGIRVLKQKDQAWRAFCLMNRAMMRQSAKRRSQKEEEVSWYPFQLCYVLMCVPDLQDTSSKWRNTVDLLWFPTGGGKTEAYLGVAAYTIFLRRITRGEQGKGVTVLMRYTLRMLTAQQFERAAALIAECELIRREERLPGGEISIGLWVGSEVTPNHVTSDQEDVETAESILSKLREGQFNEVRSSPVQLSVCPFCGAELVPQTTYAIAKGQFVAHCPNEACAFHGDLPIITVDDDVYTRKPTLLIGTIDKFARLTWEDKTGAIFGEDGEGLPPELLIQDELHLISGPLGSVSGLYEIAVERLCTVNGVKPKILASTATLCNAAGQIRALYGKPSFQFPPSGFDAGDSFFAHTASAAERPQRSYIGYCETGGSMHDALVRTFGVVRFALEYLKLTGTEDRVIDQFWSNVGYFNALKDLGSADTLIIDRVCSYAEALRRHKFHQYAESVDMPAISRNYEHGELTSRKSAREIRDVRERLDRYHYPSPMAYHYILSSNMLSVGIDINRLGLMTVYGQPKTTSEYIQATSRVGRSNPGIVIVLLHMMRTRDKSHYEQFQTYHQALNRMVEPTSATPYACRTMDKALHAVFVTLVRHLYPELRGNTDASKFRKSNPMVQRIRTELLQLIRNRSAETAEYAVDILDDFIDLWDDTAVRKGKHLQYQLLNKTDQTTDALLVPAERSDDSLFPPTMNSMRNVDTQSGVFLKRRNRA